MKPIVGLATAWFFTLLSVAGVLILSVIGLLFYTNHESMMGSINDPEDGKAVATTVFGAVAVYGVLFVLFGSQVLVHSRQGAVRLS